MKDPRLVKLVMSSDWRAQRYGLRALLQSVASVRYTIRSFPWMVNR